MKSLPAIIFALTFAVASVTPMSVEAEAEGPWIHQTELSLGGRIDDFGNPLAISSDGHTAAIGVSNRAVNGQPWAGAIELYRLRKGSWGSPTQIDLGANAAASDFFPSSLALSADGNTLIAGAAAQAVDGKPYAGAAEVFRFNAGTWSRATQIDLGANATMNEWFGGSVSLSSDGRTALVGDAGRTVRGKPGAGVVWVYRFVQGSWVVQTQLSLGAKGHENDNLGSALALSAHGNTALIGACCHVVNNYNTGRPAQVFRYANDKWSSHAQLPFKPHTGEEFGVAVAMSAHGDTALVAAGDVGGNPLINAVEVFQFKAGTWLAPTQLHRRIARDALGQSLALSADGETALLGAPCRNVNYNPCAGAAEVFRRSGTRWGPATHLDLGVTGEFTDVLGWSVALSGDGHTALVGAPLRTVSGRQNAGAVEVYTTVPKAVSIAVKASGPDGSAPQLTSLSPLDPVIHYNPASQSSHMTGTLTCTTVATASSPASIHRYPITQCSGLSDVGHRIVYDYDHSGYTVTPA